MCVSTGSLLDFLKSDEGNRVQLPKLIDFSAQVRCIQAHLVSVTKTAYQTRSSGWLFFIKETFVCLQVHRLYFSIYLISQVQSSIALFKGIVLKVNYIIQYLLWNIENEHLCNCTT